MYHLASNMESASEKQKKKKRMMNVIKTLHGFSCYNCSLFHKHGDSL